MNKRCEQTVQREKQKKKAFKNMKRFPILLIKMQIKIRFSLIRLATNKIDTIQC